MRLLLFSLTVVGCAVASGLRAQDVALPRPATQDPAPLEPTPAATVTPAPAAPELIPADLLPAPNLTAPAPTLDIPSIEQLDEGLKPPPLSPAAEAQRQHFEWRKLRNRVQNDPAVKAAFAKAEAAPTDLEKRKLLARYYELFYRKIDAIAPPDMKAYLAQRKREQLALLPQPRVRPETALPSPPPAPNAGASGAGTSPTPVLIVSPSPSPAKSSLLGLPRP